MKRFLFGTAAAVVFAAVARVASVAPAPTVGALSASPANVPVTTPTDVVFTVTIADPSLLPGGVNLLHTDAAGKTLNTIGVMHDDGLAGDTLAGDKTFTLRVRVTEPAVGTGYYRVSAAFKGVILRSLSPVFALPTTAGASLPQVQTVDAARSVSASIDESGGSLDALASDGTAFDLVFPLEALPGPTTITIAPVISFVSLPFSGGGVFSVRLQPSGLHLNRPATLFITLPPGVNASSFKGFTLNDDGTGFEILPIENEDPGTISITLSHFSAGGAASARVADFVAAFQPLLTALGQQSPPSFTQVASLVSSLVAWLRPPGGGPVDFSLCSQTMICQDVLALAQAALTANQTQACAQAVTLAQAADPFTARNVLKDLIRMIGPLIDLRDLASQAGLSGFDDVPDLSCLEVGLKAIVDAAKAQALSQPRAGVLLLLVDLISDGITLGLDSVQQYAEAALADTVSRLIDRATQECGATPDVGEALLTLLRTTFGRDFLNGLGGYGDALDAAFAGCRITITPASATVLSGDTLSFSATTIGLSPAGVSWTAQGLSGSIDATGVFTAVSDGTATVVATSLADATRFKKAPVHVVELSVTPANTTVSPGTTVHLQATVGEAGTVGWGSTGGGTLTANGNGASYVAGSQAGTFQVTATFAGLSRTADITITGGQDPIAIGGRDVSANVYNAASVGNVGQFDEHSGTTGTINASANRSGSFDQAGVAGTGHASASATSTVTIDGATGKISAMTASGQVHADLSYGTSQNSGGAPITPEVRADATFTLMFDVTEPVQFTATGSNVTLRNSSSNTILLQPAIPCNPFPDSGVDPCAGARPAINQASGVLAVGSYTVTASAGAGGLYDAFSTSDSFSFNLSLQHAPLSELPQPVVAGTDATGSPERSAPDPQGGADASELAPKTAPPSTSIGRHRDQFPRKNAIRPDA